MKIGLLDHMGYGNLGDAATQDALIANITARRPDTRFVAFSLVPADTQSRHCITAHPINWWYPCSLDAGEGGDRPAAHEHLKSWLKQIPLFDDASKRLLSLCRELRHLYRTAKLLRSLDVLIIAGGGQLSELWGGPWAHPYNVFKFSALIKLVGKRLLMLNVGAGPLTHSLSRMFVKWAVGLADYASFRDHESEALVRQAGVKRPTHVFPDSVYSLDVSVHRRPRPTGTGRPSIGINPIGFCDPRIWPRKDQIKYFDYLDKLAAFCVWLSAQDYRVKIFSGEKSVDRYAMEDLKERLTSARQPSKGDYVFRPPSLNVADVLQEIADVDFVVTAKFHGVIFCHLLSKPVIALSYHHKIDDLMRVVGHPRYCLSIEEFDAKSLQNTFTSLVHDAEDLKMRFRAAVAKFSSALRLQFDRLFLEYRSEYALCEDDRVGIGGLLRSIPSRDQGGRRA